MSEPQGYEGIASLLGRMEEAGGSDLFLREGLAPAMRRHGQVLHLEHPPTTGGEIWALLDAAALPSARARFAAEGDLDVGFSLESGGRFRLNFARQQGQLAVIARALPSGELQFADLRLPERLQALCQLPRGLILVTGSTGSGKSTTLAAMIHHINCTRRVHVVTIEDPIEFQHRERKARITQREIGGDTASFHAALKHVVRQSPDVILIGEMRDAETMAVAVSAALTGHLVLASLHTSTAVQTLQRILGYYPEHLQDQLALDLSHSLQGILCQRLLPRADGAGRALVTELLTTSPAVSRLIREKEVGELEDLMRRSRDGSMYTFNHSFWLACREGLVAQDVALAASTNPEELSLQLQGMTSGVAALPTQARVDVAEKLDLKALLRATLARGASDLHLATGRPPLLRIAGHLTPIADRPLSATDMRMLLNSIMTSRQREVYDIEREVDFSVGMEDGRRFRVNAYFQKGQMAAALRAIPATIPDANALRLPRVVMQLAERPHGLLLVVGPTGSGKSTTLACLVDRINTTRACRIITIEDPIEYTHRSQLATVDQREVFADTRGFAQALRHILRQDPDVILVGEMRDLETVSSALTAAETGHLVLATLHTNDAAQSIDRIIDVFPSHQQSQVRSQLAACLLGVVSQRLVLRKDAAGRVAAFEVMIGNSAIRNLIRDDKMHQAQGVMETAQNDGMITMDRALAELVIADQISEDEALRYSRSNHTLQQRLRAEEMKARAAIAAVAPPPPVGRR